MGRQRQIKVLKLAQRVVDTGEAKRADEGRVTDSQIDSLALKYLPPALCRTLISARKKREERGD